MGKLTINKQQDGFELDGRRFFYLGDTVWSAFTGISPDEWDFYLKKRRQQGFNVLQINTLPQWDRCLSDTGLYPFATDDGHTFDFTNWNEAYYENARNMCRMAVSYGFQLALVVLWLNYVPDTWGSRIIGKNIMPKAFVSEYAKRVAAEFDEFHPIYVISGDTDFDSPEAVSYYETALSAICSASPDSLKTMHIRRGYDVIPESFLDRLDFYMFQSGHNRDAQDMAYLLPEQMLAKYPKKPLINAEPCYEQMGYSRHAYGRFQAEDIRKAAWTSLLSGACAGVTYGAHGIWNWNKLHKPHNPVLGEGFDAPFLWQDAIQFPGAWDYGFIRHFLQSENLLPLIPANSLLANETADIRMAQAPGGRYVIYLPRSTKVQIHTKLQGYTARALSLDQKRYAVLDCDIRNEQTEIEMHPFANDAVLILQKEA